MIFSVTLNGGSPWGFRLQGGREFNEPIRIAKINPNSKAYNEGIKVGDYVESINGQKTKGLEHQNAQQMIKNATDQLVLELTRDGSKTNGTVNGELHNHYIDNQLDYLNSGDSRPTKSYKPVSFSQRQSPSLSTQNIPMTVTVNTNRVKSRTAPASPVFQRQYRTAPTSPVMFQSVLKIPPLSPRPAKRDPDMNDRDLYRGQQQTYGGVSASEKNVSADNSAWSLPIKIEAKKQNPEYNAQQSTSHDSPRSYGSPRSQTYFPPPRDFASGHGELPREIPVVVKGINESIKNLRQVPVETDQGQNLDLARSVNIERSPIQRALLREQYSSTDKGGQQGQQSPGQRREIPIQIKRGPISSQTSLESDSKPDSPRQVRIEHDKKKADLEKRRIDLERDINNVIYDAIKQVPIYDKHTKQEIKPSPIGKYPDIDPPAYGAQQSEYIIPTRVESQREKRVEEAIQHQLQADKKKNYQKDWEDMQQDHSKSYATLPGKKSSPGDMRTRQMFEADPGSYSTLPSFGHKVRRSGSPKLQRNIVHDDDVCFSDIEGGRGKAQPSWRPKHSPLVSRHVWKPNIQPTQEQSTPWAPTASPNQQRRNMQRAPMSRSLSESQGYPAGEGEGMGRRQERRAFIPIQIHHDQKPRKVGETSCDDEKDSSLSSFDTLDSSSDPKINGTQPPLKSSPKPGVWKPGVQQSPQAPPSIEKSQTEGNQSPSLKELPQKWSPGGPGNLAPKGYRPIRTDFSRAPSNKSAITAPDSYTKSLAKSEENHSWKPTQRVAPTSVESLPTSALSPLSSYSHQDESPISTQHDKKPDITQTESSVVSPPPVHNGLDHHVSTSMLHLKDEPSHLPPSQSPYITLLQKNREGKIPKGAIYLGKSESMEGDVKHTDTYYAVPSEEKTTVTTTKVSSPKRYEDIGPIDEESGMPLSFRKNVEEDKQHDWYKQMYKSLHRSKKKEATNNYKPTYQFPDDDDDTKSLDDVNPYRPSYDRPSRSVRGDINSGYLSEPEYRSKMRSKSSSNVSKTARALDIGTLPTDLEDFIKYLDEWSPASARSTLEVYRNQPRSIVDYEPGFSSIAFRESKTAGSHNPPPELPGQYSTYTEGKPSFITGKKLESSGPTDNVDSYRKIQKGGEIPIQGLQKPAPEKSPTFRHLTTEELRSQHRPSDKDQRRREEEESYRKRRLEQIYEEERRKKIIQQQADIASRKHSDFLFNPTNQQQVPSQKSPIPNDRFEYGTVPEDRRRGFKIQGKARGLYNFTAHNSRELPFRKGDIIYLIRQIDVNWFEGERNGRIGIFPVNYVEVLTSIEEASTAARQSEGQARAKYTFNSQTSVELPLSKGEVVTLLRKVDDNWFEGRVGNRQGIFPVAYVEVLQEPSTPLVTPAPSVITTPMTGRGTPEMLSPVSYDGAPTPPPQPSPGAFTMSSDNLGNRYATSPRDQQYSQQQEDSRLKSLRNDNISPQRFDGVQSQRHYDSSRHMNGGFSSPSQQQQSFNDFTARSHRSPQQIRKDNPPSLNITAKSVSTPNVSMTSKSRNYSKGTRQDEELAIARYRAIYAYRPQNEDELELLEGDEIYVMEKCDDGWYVGTSGRTGMFGTFPGNYVTRSQ